MSNMCWTLGRFMLLFSVAAAFDVWSLEQLEKAKKSNSLRIVVKDLNVPAGEALDLNGLDGRTIEFAGRVTFGYKEWNGPLINIKGKNIKVEGTKGHVIDGQGERWWDALGSNGGKTKPSFINIQLQNSLVTGLQIKNTPAGSISINQSINVNISNIDIDNSLGHSKGGLNTDGFAIANSRKIAISNSKVNNQDDCLVIRSGDGIVFDKNICVEGHGITVTIGGLNHNEARNVLIKNCKVFRSNVGIQVKTLLNGWGVVDRVTFDNIQLQDISEIGIAIIGNYLKSGSKGEPTGGIPITNLIVNNIYGNVLPKGINTLVNVKPGSASSWSWNSRVSGGQKIVECKGVPSNLENPCV